MWWQWVSSNKKASLMSNSRWYENPCALEVSLNKTNFPFPSTSPSVKTSQDWFCTTCALHACARETIQLRTHRLVASDYSRLCHFGGMNSRSTAFIINCSSLVMRRKTRKWQREKVCCWLSLSQIGGNDGCASLATPLGFAWLQQHVKADVRWLFILD